MEETIQKQKPQKHPGYKETKLGWIPEKWDWKASNVAIHYFGGNAFKSNDACSEGIKWLKIANVGVETTKWDDTSYLPSEFELIHHKYLLKRGDLVMALTRPILNNRLKIAKIKKSDEPCLLNQRVAKLISKKGTSSDFLYFVLQLPYFVHSMNVAMAGTDPPNIGSTELGKIRIPLPPLPEQKAIAHILGTWDQAIEKQQALICAQKRRKKALTQQLLTGKKRLPGFEGEFKRIGAGEIFESISNKGFEDEELLSATQDRGMIPRSSLDGRVTMPSGSKKTFKLVEVGDFVISLRSFQGGLEYSNNRGLVSPAYTVLKPKVEIDKEYYKQYFKSYDFIGHLSIAVIGIRDGKQISYKDFCTVKIPFPSVKEQKAIAQVLQTTDREIQLSEQALELLRQQKKGLMQQLLTGKVRVKEFREYYN